MIRTAEDPHGFPVFVTVHAEDAHAAREALIESHNAVWAQPLDRDGEGYDNDCAEGA